MQFNPRYTHKLLDTLIERFSLKNDAALCRALEAEPPMVSKIRNGHSGVSDHMILMVHERLAVPVAEIRELIEAQEQKA